MSMMLRFQSLLLSPDVGTFTFVYNTEERRKQAFQQALRVIDSMQITQYVDAIILTDGKIVVFDKTFLFLKTSTQINGLQFDQVIYDEIEIDKELFANFQSRIRPPNLT